MPNWCRNTIIVRGDNEADIDQFMSIAAGPSEPFDFDRLVPVPTVLKYLWGGRKTFMVDGCEVHCQMWFSKRDENGNVLEERPLTAEERMAFDELGVTGYEHWARENWGCKWNASDGECDRSCETEATYEFDTPWDPPEILIDTIRSRFPELQIIAKFDCLEDEEAGYY